MKWKTRIRTAAVSFGGTRDSDGRRYRLLSLAVAGAVGLAAVPACANAFGSSGTPAPGVGLVVGVVVDGDGVGVAGCNVVRTGLSAGLLDQEIAISSQAGGLFSITLMPGLWELKAVCLDGAAGVSAPVRVPDQGTVRVRIVAAAATPGAATRAAKPKAATAPAAPVIKGAKPKIAGKAVVGRKLKAKAGTWTAGVDLSYRWYRDGKAIAKATKASYKVKAADKGKRISVKVTAAKAGHASVTKASAKKKIK